MSALEDDRASIRGLAEFGPCGRFGLAEALPSGLTALPAFCRLSPRLDLYSSQIARFKATAVDAPAGAALLNLLRTLISLHPSRP